MISEAQMDRAEKEFVVSASSAHAIARSAEHQLESALYPRNAYGPRPDTTKAKEFFDEADYMAESRAWILSLIREARRLTKSDRTYRTGTDGNRPFVLMKDGDKYEATRLDFENLHESKAGFGDSMGEACAELLQAEAKR